jgi:transposase-like protein
MDETYVMVRGQPVYLYRTVDRAARVDFLSEPERALERCQKLFLRNAMRNNRMPTKITVDAYAASRCAVLEMKQDANFRVASGFDPVNT